MQRLIRRHRLEQSVRVVPFCRDLQPWWGAADAVACPSESESMPASVLEGMTFGLPVLATRVGGLPEIVEDGATGWLCEPNDLASLINGLARFAGASDEELRQLGQRGARLVARAHDRATALPLMSDLLDHLSRGSRPRWLVEQLRQRSANA
jgi:glycosyltransferase involved in cell wall biosynthesis